MIVSSILLVIFIGGGTVASYLTTDNQKIGSRVKISGISVEGMHIDEAEEILQDTLDLPKSIELTENEATFSIDLNENVASYDFQQALKEAKEYVDIFHEKSRFPEIIDVKAPLKIDSNFLEEELEELKTDFDNEPENAKLKSQEGTPKIKDEKKGHELEVEQTKTAIKDYLQKGITQNIPIETKKIQPEVTAEDLPEMNQKLSSFKVNIPDEEDFLHNVKTAKDKICGKVLETGEHFSFNNKIGPVSSDNDYRKAQTLIKRESHVSGGGVSLLATCLYQVSLKGKITILERHSHQESIRLISPGRDAMINYDLQDLVLRNDHDYPVIFTMHLEDDKLEVFLYSKEDLFIPNIDIHTDKVETLKPTKLERSTSNLPQGEKEILQEAQKGYRVEVYIEYGPEVKKDKEKELITEDFYRPVNEIVRVGTRPY